MVAFSSEQTIERPAAMIYEVAVDVLRHPMWMKVLDARVLNGDPTRVGGRASEHVKVGPRTYDIEFEVTVADPGRRISWRAIRGGPFAGEVTLDLSPLDERRTRATYSGRLDMKGLWRLVEPFMAREVRAEEAGELGRLKALVEALPAPATGTAAL